jgi:hypothetical protein
MWALLFVMVERTIGPSRPFVLLLEVWFFRHLQSLLVFFKSTQRAGNLFDGVEFVVL